MDKRDIARTTGLCALTGRELAEGEEHYTVLFEEGDSFRRADYALAAWNGPPDGAYCFFKTRVPVREPKKQGLLVDNDMLVNFFARLAQETTPVRLQFRFVLALILMRKRLLRYEQTVHDQGQEYWQMSLVREQSPHRVLNPHLTDEQIVGVSGQLGAILRGDFAEDGEDAVPWESGEAGTVPAEAGPSSPAGPDPGVEGELTSGPDEARHA